MSEARRELEERARSGMEAYNRGEIYRVLSLLHPDVSVTTSPTMPNAAAFSGHEEFLRWTARWEEAWESFTSKLVEVTAIDDTHVILHTRQHGVGAASGIEVDMDAFWMFEFEWDLEQTSRLGIYLTREEALAAAGRSASD
jgi:ketosteroid isomerase-like protein